MEALENLVDRYEDELGTYMVKLGGKNLSRNDSHTVSLLLHCIGDFERISDHGMNLKDSAKEMQEKEMHFQARADKELEIFLDAVKEILDMSIDAFETNNTDEASKVEPLRGSHRRYQYRGEGKSTSRDSKRKMYDRAGLCPL